MRASVLIAAILSISIVFGSFARADDVNMSLKDAISLALEHSYDIKGAEFDSASALYDYRSARSQQYPALSLNAVSFYNSKVQKLELPIISKEIGSKDNYLANLRLSQLLYAGGRVANQIKIQRENAELKSFSLESQRLGIAYLARRAYLNLMMANSLFESAKSSLRRVEIIRTDVENLYKNGVADSIDVLDAESATQIGQETLAAKETVASNASISLTQLVGYSSGKTIIPTDSLPEPNNLEISTVELNRPELKMFDKRISMADLSIKQNRGGYFPILNGYVGYLTGKPNLDQFNNTWNSYMTAGLSLNWEFNLGGKVGNSIASARNLSFAARAGRSRLEESLITQRDIAQRNLAYAYKAETIAKRGYEISQDRFRLAKDRQRAGRMSVNRLLELEADLATSEQMYRASVINYYLAETDYLYAIGDKKIYGGF